MKFKNMPINRNILESAPLLRYQHIYLKKHMGIRVSVIKTDYSTEPDNDKWLLDFKIEWSLAFVEFQGRHAVSSNNLWLDCLTMVALMLL